MSKIKYDLINKIINTNLSALAIKFILQFCKIQNEIGICEGVYYRDFMNLFKCSKAGFYVVIHELETKNIIKILEKQHNSDFEIKVLLNDFSTDDNYKNYLNLNSRMFENNAIIKLKANAIKLMLLLAKRVHAAQGKNSNKLFYIPKNEYKIYSKVLNVSTRSIKTYYEDLTEWICIGKNIVCNNGEKRDIITVKKDALKKPKITVTQQSKIKECDMYANYEFYSQSLKTYCRRNGIFYSNQNLTDSSMLINQYYKKFADIHECINKLRQAISISMQEGLNELKSNIVHNIYKKMIPQDIIDRNQVGNDNKKPGKLEKPYVKNGNLIYPNNNKFNNFSQRTYDMDKLEKELLGLGIN